ISKAWVCFVRSRDRDASRPKPRPPHVRHGESVRWRIDLGWATRRMRSVLKPIKQRRLLERGTAPADFAYAIIIKFTDRAIELSSHACVSSKMKVIAFALVLMPLICGAAEPLLPMAEGTTWNYELVQERPSASLDLTEPNEQERLSVSYRVGGTA